MLKLGLYEALLWYPELEALAASLAAERFRLIVTHDVDLLPLAAAVAGGGGKLVFDAREFYPRHFEDRFSWRFFYAPLNRYLCRRYLRSCDRMLTVSEGFADAYRRHYGIAPLVVESVPPRFDLEPRPTDGARIRIVHHGNATPSRRTESMIETMDHLSERFSLDLMLMATDPPYFEFLSTEAARRARVRIVPPVPYTELIPTTNRYDIGLFLCPPTTFNLRHTVPNKLFEFIQARLAVAIGPLPDQSAVLRRYGCGLIADDFSPQAMGKLLDGTSAAEIDELKRRAHEAAARANAEVQSQRLKEILGELLDA
jgi:hypothetical protein